MKPPGVLSRILPEVPIVSESGERPPFVAWHDDSQ